jgi:hypothetical protein
MACIYLSAHYRVRWPGFIQQMGRKGLREANQILSLGQFKECFVHFCDFAITRDETFDEAASKTISLCNSLPSTRIQPKSVFLT